jgi:hypothetical protein
MPPPQWKEPNGMGGAWGFDSHAVPPWLLVGAQSTKALLLDFAAGLVVRSVTPGVVTLSEGQPEGQSRWFMITGNNPGRGFIEVRDFHHRGLEARLEVSVKRKRTLKIGFYFVQDKAGDTTTRQPGIVDSVIDELNNIYESQTNLTFEAWGGGDVQVNIDLDDVVMKGWDAKSKAWTGDAMSLKRVWQEIVAKGDRGADFNVFFVPAQSAGDPLVLTQDNNCVIEDGVLQPAVVLPHEVGLFLGCPETSDFNLAHHLMFSFTQNPNINSRNGNFIPKACANIMNP